MYSVIIVGVRIGYVIVEWPNYINNPLEILNIRQGGLVWYTGLIGGFLGGTFYVVGKAGLVDGRRCNVSVVFRMYLDV